MFTHACVVTKYVHISQQNLSESVINDIVSL